MQVTGLPATGRKDSFKPSVGLTLGNDVVSNSLGIDLLCTIVLIKSKLGMKLVLDVVSASKRGSLEVEGLYYSVVGTGKFNGSPKNLNKSSMGKVAF